MSAVAQGDDELARDAAEARRELERERALAEAEQAQREWRQTLDALDEQ